MKVYVLTVEQVCDCEVFDNDYPRAFGSLDKAKAVFRSFVDDEIQFVERDGWIIDIDDEDEFEAYADGDYADNHTLAVIHELDVE